MKWLAIVVILCLLLLYIGIGAFGFVMSAFCFDAGTEAAAWNCFTGINLVAVLPSLLCLLAGAALLLARRYRLAMAIAAVPAVVAGIGLIALFIANIVAISQISSYTP